MDILVTTCKRQMFINEHLFRALMDEAEYMATREQRAPLLKEILEGYVPRRIDGLRERLPLEIFASSYETPPLATRRDTFVNEMNRLEDSLLAGGCQPYETLRFAYRQIMPVTEMVQRDAKRPPRMRIINDIPPVLARKAEDALCSNPYYRMGGLQHPDWPDNIPHKLYGWEGLAHPVIFRRLFTLTREFLDGMHDYLCTHVPELNQVLSRQ